MVGNITEEAGEALKAAICSGKGAVLFEEVAYALEVLDIKYQTLDEREIQLNSAQSNWTGEKEGRTFSPPSKTRSERGCKINSIKRC